jgi:hypothetical protein
MLTRIFGSRINNEIMGGHHDISPENTAEHRWLQVEKGTHRP